MHALQRQLYRDHYHFQRLLYCLQREINCYGPKSTRPAKLSVILDALDYVQVYPEKWHHPVEDVIFRRLLDKEITERELIESLLAEHESLEQLTPRVSQLFLAVANDCVVPAQELRSAAQEFIDRQSQHLDTENDLIYPLIDQYLTDEDWGQVAASLDAMADPLFDKPLQDDYQNLYRYIVEMEEEIQPIDNQSQT